MNEQKSVIVGPDCPLTKLPKSFPSHIDEELFCGLDLGIGSCGQALISTAKEKRTIRGFEHLPAMISFLGVRAFDIPEEKTTTGMKLKNPERRAKRLLRRVTARRAQRMKAIRSFLIQIGVLDANYHYAKEEWRTRHEQAVPWQWRVEALTRKLTSWEFAVILMHYGKRRGFKSARKSEIATKGSAGGTLDSTRTNHEALGLFETVADMFHRDERFSVRKRNKEESYTSMILRDDLVAEIRKVFYAQRRLENPQASEEIERDFLEILNRQKSMQDPVKLLGDCPFLVNEKRTTPLSPSFELSRALQKLNHITLVLPGGMKRLLAEHILKSTEGYAAFVAEFGKKKTITWTNLRKLWSIPNDVDFQDILDGTRKPEKDKEPQTRSEMKIAMEKEDFCKRSGKNGCAEGSYLLRKAIGEETWQQALSSDFKQIDQIAFSLAFYETVEDPDSHFTIIGSLVSANVPEFLIAAVRSDFDTQKPTLHNFGGTCGTSSALCRRIIPYLLEGLTYDKAMSKAGFEHTNTTIAFKDIVNPVAKTVIREVMKQIVHLIDEAGALPGRIVVELGRDLGKSIAERNEIDLGIKKRTKTKDANREEVALLKGCEVRSVSDEDLLRYELYLEQGGFCPYSGDQLPNKERLYGPDLQVDHILPRSRSHDNSYDNKVLVYSKSNQNKGNNTPYEWLSSTDTEWTAYNTRIDGMHRLRKRKRMNLLNSSFAEEESCFADRNLNDTRYISKVITAYLDAIYTEAGHKTGQDKGGTRRVFARPGAMTSMVRKAWGLEEFKKDFNGQRIGDKHHAVDALVCACLAEGNAQWISRISNAYGSSEMNRSGHIALRGLQPPWENFRSDVVTALSQITVSRRERCGAGGQLHLETVYRARKDEDGKKIALKRTSIVGKNSAGKAVASFTKIGDLDKIAGIHEERSRWLKDALQEWIKHGSPLEPELLPRDPQGCLIRKVYVQQKSMNLRKQPQGHVTSGTIVRCDVFSKVEKGKKVYHLVPVYNYQLIEKCPPMKAIMANKTEEEWTLLDQAYHFEFSLWKNSCIEIRFKDGVVNKGYYSGINRSNGRIAYKLPNDAYAEKDETGEDLVFSTKSGVTSFHKITVDRLGRTFPVKSEKRTWRGAVCI